MTYEEHVRAIKDKMGFIYVGEDYRVSDFDEDTLAAYLREHFVERVVAANLAAVLAAYAETNFFEEDCPCERHQGKIEALRSPARAALAAAKEAGL